MGFRYKYSLLRCASGVIIGTVFSSAQHITLQACNLYVTTFGNPICNLFVTHSETICRAPTEVFAVNPDGSISAPGGQCLGISGTNVTAQPCTGVSTQKWVWLPNGCVASVADSSSCWNAWAGNTSPGTPISMFACGSVSNVAANDVFFYDAQKMHIVGNEVGDEVIVLPRDRTLSSTRDGSPRLPFYVSLPRRAFNSPAYALLRPRSRRQALRPVRMTWAARSTESATLRRARARATHRGRATHVARSSSLSHPPAARTCGRDAARSSGWLHGNAPTPTCVCTAAPPPLRSTWNGPIMRGPDGIYHLYVPVYEHGSLWNVIYTAHGTSASVAGPYNWSSEANISSTGLNPAGLVFPNVTGGGALVYSLWDQADILTSSSPSGPFVRAFNNPEPSSTAPVFYGGAFYMTDQAMRTIITTKSLAGPWTVFANISLPRLPYTVEDPFLWVDKRGAFHIINHAYDTGQTSSCGSSYVSSHSFSADGVVWGHGDQPYDHTVEFDDGTNHTYCTLERPYLVFDDTGLITHIHLAADLVTGDEGCGPTPCVNCKYADHAGTLLVALG